MKPTGNTKSRRFPVKVVIAAVVVVALCVFAVRFGLWRMRSNFTTDKPAEIQAPVLSIQQEHQAERKYKELSAAISSRREASFVLTGEDLNRFFESSDEGAAMNTKAVFALIGDILGVQTTFPAETVFAGSNYLLEQFKGRYFACSFKCTVTVENGVLNTEIIECQLNKRKLGDGFLDILNNGKKVDDLLTGFIGKSNLERIKSMKIKDDRCYITTAGSQK